ncbi:MAG: aminotransferase class I/II-fold pyridoxal phosphate-dependent enzyme [Actinomycetota bacterium]
MSSSRGSVEPLEDRLYLSAPDLRGREIEYVTAALESGWVAPIGPDLSAFEDEISKLADGRHAVGLSSGTAALQLALQTSGVEQGDDVLCSTLTFVATANAIIQAGCKPVMVDSDYDTWNMDPDLLAEELDRRAKAGNLPAAVVTVDLYGQCCNYNRIVPICAQYDVPLIEDAAEALGATYDGKGAGSFGEIAIFSFNGNKIITTSGGGMLVTPDEAIADRVRYLSTQARQPAAHYEHTEVGYNYRLSNILAALGRAQLRDLDDRVLRRREFNRRYQEAMAHIPGVSFMPEAEDCYSTFWLTCLTIDPAEAGVDRETIRLGLEEFNVESRPVWKPMHRQPVFAEAQTVLNGVSDQLFKDGLCLPSGSAMSDQQFEYVVERVLDLFDAA